MDIQVPVKTLLKPLQQVSGVVEKRQTLPILSHVKMDLQNGLLNLVGTDCEVELQATAAVEGAATVATTVPGRKLLDICKALPGDSMLTLQESADKLTVKAGRSRFVLTTLPAKDFPTFEDGPGDLEFTLAQTELRTLFEKTLFAVAQQDVRHYLNGVLLEVTEGSLRTVGTDGHRLAFSELSSQGIRGGGKTQAILPLKGAGECMRLLEDSEDPVTITLGSHFIRFSGANFTVTSKLIDSEYPNYRAVIPTDCKKHVEMGRDDLKQALQRISILSNERYHGVKLKLKENNMHLLANNPQQEEAEEDLMVNYTGDAFHVAFNINYLLDGLNAQSGATVKLNFSDKNFSLLMEDPQNPGSATVVMPMQL